MKKNLNLSSATIKQNIQKLQEFLHLHKLDGFYVSSFDAYLNEYVPLEDCHRFYVTGFTGSTAEVLVPAQGKVLLYVDGRYHEQADNEVDSSVIQVVKCDASISNQQALLRDITSHKMKRVGVEGDRTSLSFFKRLESVGETVSFMKGELTKVMSFETLPAPKEVQFVERDYRGRDTLEKTRLMFKNKNEGIFVAALDAIAWVTNCRGYHLPHLSSYRAKALLTLEKVYVFVTPETPLSKEAQKADGIEWLKIGHNEFPATLSRLQNTLHLEKVWFDPGMLNCADFGVLLNTFGPSQLIEKPMGLAEWMSIKEPAEIRVMEEGFKRGDKAIFETIKWVKDSVKAGKRITELDLWRETGMRYEAQGSVEQSFNTIAGVGPNGSIIHYGTPSDEVVVKEDDMVLLDSGGYFKGGFATDTTRTFFASHEGKPKAEYKKIYTLVLKGMLNCMHAVFPVGTKGNVLDGIARAPIFKHGYNFNHGTGHGVGIHVHEDGVRISVASQLPMKAGQVVSIEPGIYIPGFGGVRIENIAVVEKHTEFDGFLKFRNLVWVGFDSNLVDETLLNNEEKKWLADFEAEAKKRGTAFAN